MSIVTRWKRSIIKRHQQNRLYKFSDCWSIQSKISNLIITLPFYINYVIIYSEFNNKYIIFIYDCNYSFPVTIEGNNINYLRYYNSTNSIYINYMYEFRFLKFGRSHLFKILRVFGICFLRKVKIHGRKWRVYSRDHYRTLSYRFSIAHHVWICLEGLYIKWHKKRRISIFGRDYCHLTIKMDEVQSWYPMGEYTERGVCLKNKPYIVRIGKVEKTVIDFRGTEIT